MTQATLSPGRRVVVRALGETPMGSLEANTALEPMAAPEPASLAPEDVIIAIKSAHVGWVDLLMMSGQYQHALAPPYTPGMEYAGVVAWKGPGVGDALAVGDEVLIDPFVAGARSLGAYQKWGGLASYGVAPARAVLRVPAGLSLDEAACLLGSYETAYHCLVTRGRLTAEDTVLVLGASGATGLAAVQVAKVVGATVIATGRSPDKLAIVRQEGADHVLATTGEGGGARPFRDEVKSLTGGRGVSVVYDAVGGETSLESLRCVAFGARYLVVGWASTPFVARGRGERGAPNANQLPTNLIMMKGLDVLGCPTAIATVNAPSLRAPRLAQVLAWAASGAIKPRVSRVFALDDYQEAMRARWQSDLVGGCVLRP